MPRFAERYGVPLETLDMPGDRYVIAFTPVRVVAQ